MIPLLMNIALTKGYKGVLWFIECFWREQDHRAKQAVLAIMNPHFKKKSIESKWSIYKMLPGYVETVLGKIGNVEEPYQSILRRKLSEEN